MGCRVRSVCERFAGWSVGDGCPGPGGVRRRSMDHPDECIAMWRRIMSYTYEWFGVLTGWAFLTGCMFGMASLATRQMVRAPVRATAQEPQREVDRSSR